ncbi:hypothetical protein NDA07_06995 [Microcoleus vaginatus DQ-U2]|uniref:hypothetical protein n=1 Tax=Microcoleus vaginatus TaxID=119532 RepID=UPI0032A786DF
MDVKKIHPLVMDLNEQSQESISGGKLPEEFAAELATLYAIALRNFINQPNNAKQ